MEFNHKPVLFRETIEALHIQPNADKVQTISEEDLNALDAMIYGALL